MIMIKKKAFTLKYIIKKISLFYINDEINYLEEIFSQSMSHNLLND